MHQNPEIIFDFKQLSTDKVFSSNAIYSIFNFDKPRACCIDGIRLLKLLKDNKDKIKLLINKLTDQITYNKTYIKFNSYVGD